MAREALAPSDWPRPDWPWRCVVCGWPAGETRQAEHDRRVFCGTGCLLTWFALHGHSPEESVSCDAEAPTGALADLFAWLTCAVHGCRGRPPRGFALSIRWRVARSS